MLATTQPLTQLTAAELMTRDLVTIPEEMSLRAAAHLLSQAHVSGAPVVNRQQRCVGVLSATDFVHWAEEGCDATVGHRAVEAPVCDWEVIDIEVLPADEVRGHMTPDPVTARPATPVSEVARMMIDAHIHRVIIVDERGKPVGIVSSTDILAAVAGRAAHPPCEV
jgi:CBS-domain-containing membrane protein